MGGPDEQELRQAASLLAAEFPETPRSVLETTLRDCYCDIPEARRKLLELVQQNRQREPSSSYRQRSASGSLGSPDSSNMSTWLTTGWNQGIRDLGLESFTAQLSLLGKQVAQGLNSILPDDLNPFGLYDDEDEEEGMAETRAVSREDRDKESSAVTPGRLQSRARVGSPSASGLKRFSSAGEDEEEADVEDYDKLN